MSKLRNFINTRANDEGLYASNEVDNLEKEIRADERAKVIDELVEKIEEKLKEPNYQHEDWRDGLIIAQDIAEQLKLIK